MSSTHFRDLQQCSEEHDHHREHQGNPGESGQARSQTVQKPRQGAHHENGRDELRKPRRRTTPRARVARGQRIADPQPQSGGQHHHHGPQHGERDVRAQPARARQAGPQQHLDQAGGLLVARAVEMAYPQAISASMRMEVA